MQYVRKVNVENSSIIVSFWCLTSHEKEGGQSDPSGNGQARDALWLLLFSTVLVLLIFSVILPFLCFQLQDIKLVTFMLEFGLDLIRARMTIGPKTFWPRIFGPETFGPMDIWARMTFGPLTFGPMDVWAKMKHTSD